MKKKYIIIFLITIIVIFISILSIYKFTKHDNKENIIINIGDKRDEVSLDYTEYKDKLLYNNGTTMYYFEFYKENKAYFEGLLSIIDGYLYIKDLSTNEEIKLSDEKFLYQYGCVYDDLIYNYAITENNELYLIELYEPDISKTKLTKFNISYKPISFLDMFIPSNNELDYSLEFPEIPLVMSDDGKVYDAYFNRLYDSTEKYYLKKYVVYSDNTVSDIYNNMFVDSNNDNYIISKMIINYDTNKVLDYNPDALFVSNNNKLFFKINNSEVLEYKYTVKDVNSYVKNGYKYVTIKFDNNSKITFYGDVINLN